MQKALERKIKTKNFPPTPRNLVDAEKRKMFEIMFLHNNEDQTVEVIESQTIDFNAVIEHLGEGNSIFIAPKIQASPQRTVKCKGHSYINHI